MKTITRALLLITMILFLLAFPSSAEELVQSSKIDSVVVVPLLPDSQEVAVQDISIPALAGPVSIDQILTSLLVVLIGLIVIRFLSEGLEKLAQRNIAYQSKMKISLFVFRIIGWMLIIYIVMARIFDLSYLTYLVLLSFVLLTIGFASRDLVRNILGGIMLLFDKPFRVGDKIDIENYYGEITKIDLRKTTLLTPDSTHVIIPNGKIVREVVANSNMGEFNKKIETEFYLPVSLDVKLLKKVAARAVSVSKYAYLVKPVEIFFRNEIHEGRSFLKMTVNAFVSDLKYEEAFSSEITELVMDYIMHNSDSDMAKMLETQN